MQKGKLPAIFKLAVSITAIGIIPFAIIGKIKIVMMIRGANLYERLWQWVAQFNS
jgi:hypothetical protein